MCSNRRDPLILACRTNKVPVYVRISHCRQQYGDTLNLISYKIQIKWPFKGDVLYKLKTYFSNFDRLGVIILNYSNDTS